MKTVSKKYLDDLTYEIIGAAIEVHEYVGGGLYEKVYHDCLKKEFEIRGIKYSTEHPVEINYKGEKIGTNLRCDFVIEDQIVLELKSVQEIHPVFFIQVKTYMELLKKPKGILLNFWVKNLTSHGKHTIVNEYFSALPGE